LVHIVYKMKKGLIACLLIGIVSSFQIVKSQYNNFKSYNIEEGLSQSTVYTIIQDKRGYLWLGTEGGGVCRFDGVNFETFDKKRGLGGNVARSIFEDSKGNLWIGTEAGISVYDGLNFYNFGKKDSLPDSPVLCFHEDDENYIWAGTSGEGLYKIKLIKKDSIDLTIYTTDDGLSNNLIFDIHEDKKGRMWLGTFAGGISILTKKGDEIEVHTITKSDGIPSDVILSIDEDKEGNMWFGTYNAGAFKLITSGADSGKVYTYNLINGINDNRVWSVKVDSEGLVWFATDEGGINLLKDGKFTAFTEKTGLPDNQILCVFEDQAGVIWAGTMGSGLVKFIGSHFSHYSIDEGLSNNQVSDIEQDKYGNYWLSSWDGITQLNFINGNPITRIYTTKDGLIDNAVKSIAASPDGTLWFATTEGISRLMPKPLNPYGSADENDKAEFTNFTEDNGLIYNVVNCILVDDSGRVWCGTRGGVSMMLGDDMFVNIDENDGLINNEVQTIIQSSDGLIWFGTWGGLAKTNLASMTTYDEEEGLYDKSINCLAEGPNGNIWIGTFGGGLYMMDVHTEDTLPIKFKTDDSLLSSNNIYSLLFQDDNNLIVGTEKGFEKLTLDENQNILQVKSYNHSDGFTGVENNLNAICLDDKMNIWFGTVKGVTRYTPAAERINLKAPQTHIVGMKLFLNEVDWKARKDSVIPWLNLPFQLELPYNENHITFEFTAINMTNPEKIQYQYKLEPFDHAWINTSLLLGSSKYHLTLPYSNLPPGDYTFNVKAANENGIWNDKPTEYHFVIRPPFWQTWWFYMLCAFISVISVIAFVKVREKNLKREKAILEDKVRERTRELAEKNEEITASITYAQNIQRAILPSVRSIEKGFTDSFVLFRPRDIVSGDFYWYADKEDKSFIAACDCTGHGVPGAFVSMIGNNLLNQIILEKNIENPGEIISQLNRGVKFAFTQEGEQEAQDGMDMVLCVLDKKKGILQFAGANNPIILIRDDEFEVIKADRKSIGGDTSVDFNFQNFELEIKKGDTFYMFTDGYPDQFGGGKGKKFMMKRYREMISENYKKPMSEQREIYHQVLLDWMGTEYEQIDDILVIGVKV